MRELQTQIYIHSFISPYQHNRLTMLKRATNQVTSSLSRGYSRSYPVFNKRCLPAAHPNRFQSRILKERVHFLSTSSSLFQEDEYSASKWMKLFTGLGASLVLVSSVMVKDSNMAECCGIAGVVGTGDNDAR